ncbi:MAG: hypothetical protein LBQ20_13035 [Rhodanobacter sp.]|jgi:threonine dehydrogenase-like Zn-dependent dehydrogenase|nr:hypothetical protein [Rhodanobacter sp.]
MSCGDVDTTVENLSNTRHRITVHLDGFKTFVTFYGRTLNAMPIGSLCTTADRYVLARHGVDVSIEASDTQNTFESALRVLHPGGCLSSLGVYSGDLKIPLDAFSPQAWAICLKSPAKPMQAGANPVVPV